VGYAGGYTEDRWADNGTAKGVAVKRRYAVVLTPTDQADEVGYTVTVPSLPGCITEGDSVDEALREAREAIALFLETLDEDGEPIPASDTSLTLPISDEIVTSVEVETPERALSR
jgi:predicted RNase H-like HicB family nuclease